jgi:hypothetical protein
MVALVALIYLDWEQTDVQKQALAYRVAAG